MTRWCHSSPGKRYAGPLNNKNRSFLLSLGYFTCINNQYIQQGAIVRIEVTIAKTSPLPAGAIDALAGELSRRIQYAFPDNEGHVSVRYAAANNLSVIGATKEDKQRISEILQETWESADDWFVSE